MDTRYEEALERAKSLYGNSISDNAILEHIFPQLAESEDERIRMILIESFERANCSEIDKLVNCRLNPAEILAWLKKKKDAEEILLKAGLKPYRDGNKWCVLIGDNLQDGICGFGDTIDEALYELLKDMACQYQKLEEQKPEHLELKAGKWYICHRAFCCRADHLTVKEGERFQCEKDGIVKGFVIKEPEKYFKQCSAPAPMEDEQKEQKPDIELIQRSWYMEGYIDGEFKREPKWILKTGEGGPRHEPNPRYGEPLAEQKPAEWSEEDEKMLRNVYESLYAYQCDIRAGIMDKNSRELLDDVEKEKQWLKSLRHQLKQEWSEEDEKIFQALVHDLGVICEKDYPDNQNLKNELDWLKSLRPQPKQEWSEEDERKIVELKTFIAQCNGFNKKNRKKAFDMIDALPSQSHWKPSEEQMNFLLRLEGELRADNHPVAAKTLAEIYEQLKAL